MFDSGTYIWTLMIGILTLLLGIAIYFGYKRSKKVTPREEARADHASHALYESEDKGKLP